MRAKERQRSNERERGNLKRQICREDRYAEKTDMQRERERERERVCVCVSE